MPRSNTAALPPHSVSMVPVVGRHLAAADRRIEQIDALGGGAFSASILTWSGVQVDDTAITVPAPMVSSRPPLSSITAAASSS